MNSTPAKYHRDGVLISARPRRIIRPQNTWQGQIFLKYRARTLCPNYYSPMPNKYFGFVNNPTKYKYRGRVEQFYQRIYA